MNPTLQKTLCLPNIIPDKVNRTAQYRLDASGKGINVTRVLSQLGKKAIHLTQLGGDLKSLFLSLCEKDNLDIRWVESGSAVRFCYTLIAGQDDNRTVTELVEEGESVEEGTEDRLLEKYKSILPECSTVIFSGTKAPGYSDVLVPNMVRLAGEQEKRIILDVRGSDLKESLVYKPDVIKPNLFEFTETFAPEFKKFGELSGDEDGVKDRIRDIMMELCRKYQTSIVLSRGTCPVWYCAGGRLSEGILPQEESFAEAPVEKVKPVNTTGSGDAFTAGLASSLEEGASLGEAVACGIRCGGLNAALLKPGVMVT
jgi:1-phosphofructokinase/tagatose 6-phosphate kinase